MADSKSAEAELSVLHHSPSFECLNKGKNVYSHSESILNDKVDLLVRSTSDPALCSGGKSGNWACHLCQYENVDPENRRCALCGSHRQDSISKTLGTAPLSSSANLNLESAESFEEAKKPDQVNTIAESGLDVLSVFRETAGMISLQLQHLRQASEVEQGSDPTSGKLKAVVANNTWRQESHSSNKNIDHKGLKNPTEISEKGLILSLEQNSAKETAADDQLGGIGEKGDQSVSRRKLKFGLLILLLVFLAVALALAFTLGGTNKSGMVKNREFCFS